MENKPLAFDTVSQSLSWLKDQGYTHDFNTWLDSPEPSRTLYSGDFMIDHIFRFEGDSDPDDEDAVYAISSDKLDIKGVLTTAFGTYADDLSITLITKLAFRQ